MLIEGRRVSGCGQCLGELFSLAKASCFYIATAGAVFSSIEIKHSMEDCFDETSTYVTGAALMLGSVVAYHAGKRIQKWTKGNLQEILRNRNKCSNTAIIMTKHAVPILFLVSGSAFSLGPSRRLLLDKECPNKTQRKLILISYGTVWGEYFLGVLSKVSAQALRVIHWGHLN